jgi:hypothetical protein
MPSNPHPFNPTTVAACEQLIRSTLDAAPDGITARELGRVLMNRRFREIHSRAALKSLVTEGTIEATVGKKLARDSRPPTIYRLAGQLTEAKR